MSEVTTRRRGAASDAAPAPFDPQVERQQLAEAEALRQEEELKRRSYMRPGTNPNLKDCLTGLEDAAGLSDMYERDVNALCLGIKQILRLDDADCRVPNRDAVLSLLQQIGERAQYWADGLDTICEQNGAWTPTSRAQEKRQTQAQP